MIKQRVDQCAVGIARRGMHHHALGLVDHQQIVILIDYLQRDILGKDRNRLRIVGDDRDDVLRFRLIILLHRLIADRDLALKNQAARGGTAESFDLFGEIFVDADAGVGGVYAQYKAMHLFRVSFRSSDNPRRTADRRSDRPCPP